MSRNRQERAPATSAQHLPSGRHIERHRHPDHQIVFPSSGAAEIRTDAGSWMAPGDRAVWIPAGCWHEHHIYASTTFNCVYFPRATAPDLTAVRVIAAVPLTRELIIACSTATDLPAAERDRLAQVLLDRVRRTPDEPLRLPAARDARLRQACALVDQDLAAPWTLAELGHRVGAAERTLSRLFRAELGMTFPQWRTQLRLHRAMRLLAEDVSVTSVAHRCGWSSASAFIDVYRKVLGHTPGAYRRVSA